MLAELLLLAQDLPGIRDQLQAADQAVRHLRSNAVAAFEDPERAPLLLWTLLEAGDHEARPEMKGLIQVVTERRPTSTRSAALQVRALSLLGRDRHRDRIADCLQLLVDQQADDGFWGPGGPSEPLVLPPPVVAPRPPGEKPNVESPTIRLVRRFPGPAKGDPANAHWALIGLLAAPMDVRLPAGTFPRIAETWKDPGLDPAHAVLGLYPGLARNGGNWRKDPDYLAAWERLDAQPLPLSPRGWLDALWAHETRDYPERARFGAIGLAALLAAQKPDGSWGDLESSCWALHVLSQTGDWRLPRPR